MHSISDISFRVQKTRIFSGRERDLLVPVGLSREMCHYALGLRLRTSGSDMVRDLLENHIDCGPQAGQHKT